MWFVAGVVRCSLFVVCRVLIDVCCFMCVVGLPWCSLIDVVVRRLLVDVVMCCVLAFVVRCVLCVVCGLLFGIVCCLLFVVGCVLCVDC